MVLIASDGDFLCDANGKGFPLRNFAAIPVSAARKH